MSACTDSGESSRVIVVGAGLAGLHAAWRLDNAGIEVLVLEARDRVGGRTWSATLDSGAVIERGGEFIAPGQHCLRDLSRELGLELIAHGFSFDRRPAPRRPAPTDEQLDAFTAAAHARASSEPHDRPAAALLPARDQRTDLETSIIGRVQTSLTVPLEDASGQRLFGASRDRYDPAARVRGGNDSIARALADRLGDRIRLKTPVIAVDYDDHAATVHLPDGESLTTAVVVLAIPLVLLLTLTVRPALPSQIVAASEHLRFGDAAKLHIPLQTAVAPGGVALPDELWWCWVSAAPDGASGAPALSAFAGGAATVSALGVDNDPQRWVAAALSLRPDAAIAGQALVTHWGDERFTGGSYSAPGVGITARDDEAWARNWGALVFAGEHTAGAAAGTMNGAAESGARAARTVIDLIRR